MTAQVLLAVMLLLPWAGAAFALVLPAEDRLTLRAIGVATGLGTLALGVVLLTQGGATAIVPWTTVALSFSGWAAPAALVVTVVATIAMRTGAPTGTRSTPAFVVCVLGALALSLLSVISEDPRVAVAMALVAAVPMFVLVALLGGPQRGSVTYRAAGLWILADVAALAAYPFLDAGSSSTMVVVAALGPGLLRLAAGPLGLWALPVLEQAPLTAACLAAGAAGPVGATLLWRLSPHALPLAVEPSRARVTVVVILAVAAVMGAALVVAERDLRRLVAHLMGVSGALAAVGFVAGDVDDAIRLALLSALAACCAFTSIDAVEYRLETRGVHELAGLAAGAPLLAGLLPLSLAALAGMPLLGTGGAAWPLIGRLAFSPDRTCAVVGVVFGATLLAVSLAGVVVLGRASLPPRRGQAIYRVTFQQSVWLLLPWVALVSSSLTLSTALSTASNSSPGSRGALLLSAPAWSDALSAPEKPMVPLLGSEGAP
jgi:formate hydrogenlyase subunit 3/multisubunit Na+/H+ antiporter MnhD subunit